MTKALVGHIYHPSPNDRENGVKTFKKCVRLKDLRVSEGANSKFSWGFAPNPKNFEAPNILVKNFEAPKFS